MEAEAVPQYCLPNILVGSLASCRGRAQTSAVCSRACVRVSFDQTHCHGGFDGLQLEEDFAALFWTHGHDLLLGHPQQQLTGQDAERAHRAATTTERSVSDT